MRLVFLLLLQVLLFLPLTAFAGDGGKAPFLQNHKAIEVTEAQKAGMIKAYGRVPLYFIENKGQVDGHVSFYEKGAGHTAFFTEKGVVLSLTRRDGKTGKVAKNNVREVLKVTGEALSLSFVGANKGVKITAENKKTGHVNYFIGRDKSKWRSNIPTYGALTYEGVYKNIDIKFYGNNNNIEHDVIVRPGGDISEVKFAYRGIKGLKITDSGDLEVMLKDGKLVGQKPLVYQVMKGRRVAVNGSYRLFKGDKGAFSYGFKVASYDHAKEIVIDPVLEWSTYLGGAGVDFGFDIAVDSTGATYVTGDTTSADFPVVSPIQSINAGTFDAFVTKINPAGSAIVYSTYLGGANSDQSSAIAVDSSGAAYVTGSTLSADFPVVNALQVSTAGGFDAFIAKLTPTGSALVYSTYLGGVSTDVGKGIAVDSSGAAYVTGGTLSADFPVVNALQVSAAGEFDVFIAKLTPTGSALVYSTYLGGVSTDVGKGIAVDSSGAAYVTGSTISADFPVVSALQAGNAGLDDVFIAKLNPAGSALVYSTYLGGAVQDKGNDIAVDSSGAAYVTGSTISKNFPVASPIQGVFGGGILDAFITKLNPAGSALVYSTYLGGVNVDEGRSIAVDNLDTAYVTGWTSSSDFPLMEPMQALNASFDAFVTKLNPAGSALVYSTYLGGTGDDSGDGIAVDSAGFAYVTGETSSLLDFPLMNPLQGASGGSTDTFISKISGRPVVSVTLLPDVVSIGRIVRGSTLGFKVRATNSAATKQCFKYWANISLPDGSIYPPVGELFGPATRCLGAVASKTVHHTLGVPVGTPAGAYVLNAFISTNSMQVIAEAHFNFDVTLLGPLTNHPETSWRLIEKGF